MIDERKEAQEVKDFTEQTTKEGKWWDWTARILPLVAICTVAVLHYFKLHDIRDLFLDIVVIVFFTICFVWWYWAIQKIVSAAKYLNNSRQRFADLAKELRKLKKDIRHDDSNR